ncbi:MULTISPECIES: hypothetical protein [Streptomyces]|uniref:hypothetical protein n=1 Tax=Streptomyces TaxID=1883 RepID=UPI0014166FB2|nr:hypothetical protein [Streptomyces sp. SID7805]MYU54213.1 hypothetical protein [Streptomyces sp. SID7805]
MNAPAPTAPPSPSNGPGGIAVFRRVEPAGTAATFTGPPRAAGDGRSPLPVGCPSAERRSLRHEQRHR